MNEFVILSPTGLGFNVFGVRLGFGFRVYGLGVRPNP
jgi:hypothetical protein